MNLLQRMHLVWLLECGDNAFVLKVEYGLGRETMDWV